MITLMKSKSGFSFVVLLLLVVFGGGAVAVDDWPMFHHDLGLTGYSTSTAPDTDDVLWIYDTYSGPIYSSPVIVDGKLYVGSLDSNLYVLNAVDGALVWTYLADGPIFSSPAIADGKVYFLSVDGSLYALNAHTGALVWKVQIGPGLWDWSCPAVHNGKVFIAASNGWVHSLDAGTGTTIWSTFIGGYPDSPIAVVNGKVYSGTHNFDNSSPTLVALDEATGAIVWTYDYHLYHGGVVGMINSNGVAVVDGDGEGDLEVYFGVYNSDGVDDQAVCLDEATGTEVWSANINGNSTSTPAVHDGRVYIGSDDGNIYALDAGSGAYLWSFQTGDQVWAAPAVADGKVFVGSWDHTFYALDEVTGALVWSYYTGASRLMGSPAVAYGNVYVGNENGKVYAFGSDDTDKDGLLNDWETDGIDINGDGNIDLDLPALGADPLHKDLFVEVDAMVGRAPTQAALNRVVTAFAVVPNNLVNNPDGTDGISLHIQLDETNIPLAHWPTNWWASFDNIKNNRFGTPGQRSAGNWSNIRDAKAMVYRYCVFANTYGGSDSSGQAELPGDDFMVTLGAWTPAGGTEDQQVGTFMHEFGHNLNLGHGGEDRINFKPNYHSLMNYHWQVPHSNYVGWLLDYSHEALPALDESNLDENTGIGGAAGFTVPIGPLPTVVVNESGPVDWNRDGDTTDTGVAADITHVRTSDPGGPSPGQVLTGHNDWPVLWYELGGHGNFQDGVHDETTIPEEMTYEVYLEMDGVVPVGDYVDISVGRVGYDRRTGRFSVNVTVTNTSAEVIGSPVQLMIESISDASVTVANASGANTNKPYVDLSDLLGDAQLDPGESVTTRTYFNNPSRVRFTFEASVRGVI